MFDAATSFISSPFIFSALLCYLLTVALVPASIKMSYSLQAVDMPGDIKIHHIATPRLGGLAIFVSFAISILLFPSLTTILPLGGRIFFSSSLVLLFLLGSIDDTRNLSANIKLIIQIISTALAVMGIATVYPDSHIAQLIAVFLFILVFTNSFNLIDGMDGLAGGLAMILAFAIGVLALVTYNRFIIFISILVVSSATGFLLYNLNPARVFLGDCGSTFLGFTLAILLSMLWLNAEHQLSFVPLLLMAGLPLFDTFSVLLKRTINKKPIFAGDRNHSYDVLLQKGFTPFQTLAIFYSISFFVTSFGVFLFIFYLT